MEISRTPSIWYPCPNGRMHAKSLLGLHSTFTCHWLLYGVVLEISQAASGHLTFISFGQPNAIVCVKSLVSLRFAVTNIWEFDDNYHGDLVHTFHLVPMPEL